MCKRFLPFHLLLVHVCALVAAPLVPLFIHLLLALRVCKYHVNVEERLNYDGNRVLPIHAQNADPVGELQSSMAWQHSQSCFSAELVVACCVRGIVRNTAPPCLRRGLLEAEEDKEGGSGRLCSLLRCAEWLPSDSAAHEWSALDY